MVFSCESEESSYSCKLRDRGKSVSIVHTLDLDESLPHEMGLIFLYFSVWPTFDIEDPFRVDDLLIVWAFDFFI